MYSTLGTVPALHAALNGCTMNTIEALGLKIAHRSHCSCGTVKLRLQQRTSYAIRSSVATTNLARMPSHIADLKYPVQA